MGHREQDLFDQASWKLAILVPIWTVQIALMLSLMGIFAYRLADTIENWADEGHTFNRPTVLFIWECTNVCLNLLALVLTCVEVSKYASETLTPFSMLSAQAVKLTCGCANLALDVVVHVLFPQGGWSIIGIAIGCGLVAAGLAPLIYAIIAYRRVSKLDEYTTPTGNVKHYGYESSYRPDSSSYQKQTAAVVVPAYASSKTLSLSSSKALSLSSFGGGFSDDVNTARDAETGGDGPGQQGQSHNKQYNHERDTNFDEFVRRRSRLGVEGVTPRQQQKDQQQKERSPRNPVAAAAAADPGREGGKGNDHDGGGSDGDEMEEKARIRGREVVEMALLDHEEQRDEVAGISVDDDAERRGEKMSRSIPVVRFGD